LSLLHCSYTACYIAAKRGKLDALKYLASKGANVNNKTIEGSVPLIAAVSMGNFEIVEYLLSDEQQFCDVNITTSKGLFPLYAAIDNNNEDMVKLLIERGANVEQKNSHG